MADLDVEIPTDIPALKELDSLLRCGICYEHMKTSMVTGCSHNYCSICIRRSLVYRTQCPSCSTEAFDHQLRNNRIIDSIIEVFFRLLNEIKKCNKDAKEIPISAIKLTPELSEEPVRKICLKNNEPVGDSDVRKCVAIDGRNKDVLKTYDSIEVPSTSTHVPETVETSTQNLNEMPTSTKMSSRYEQQIPSIFSPSKKLKIILVACPVCSVDILEKNINAHLDACLKRSEQPIQPSSPLKMQKRKPLPKLVYSLLQDKELKKKLKEHGLSTQGDRKTLVNRHQRFTLLHNSECDVLNPRSVVDLIKQLEKEEQEEKRVTAVSTSSKLKIDRKTDPKLIENANQEYIQQHKSSYEMLIQSIKKRDEKKHSPEQNTSKTQKESSNKRISDDDIIEIVNKEEPPVKNDIVDDEDEGSLCYSPLSNVGMEVSENAENFDVSYNSSDGAVSPILGKTSISLKNESVCMRRSVTPDLFQQSSESPSLLSDFMLEPGLRNENDGIVSATSVKAKTENTLKRLNSHLGGSDFEELSDDFDIRKSRRRNAKKFPETSPSVSGLAKRRVLRKRTKC